MRVYDIAKEYGFQSKELAEIMKAMGIPVKNHMSALSAQQEKYFRNNFDKDAYILSKETGSQGEKAKKEETNPKKADAKSEKDEQKEAVPQKKTESKPELKKEAPAPKQAPKEEEPAIVVIYDEEDKKEKPGKKSRDRKEEIDINKIDNQNVKGKSKEALKQGDTERGGKKRNKKNKPKKPAVVPKFIDNSKKSRATKSKYKKKGKEERKEKAIKEEESIKSLVIPANVTVGDLAGKMEKAPTELIKVLMGYGIMAGVNQAIDFDTAQILADDFNYELELEDEDKVVDDMADDHFENEDELEKRPPIITVMGHVDHGKTSLLDAIRDANVIAGEAGGITQHIGAYTITLNGKKITFIDTPGHEAFTAMRSRGASVTDIAILVVAADDGVMPQTVEAINHAKDAEVPIIVAVNKIDKPGANPDRVKQELTEHGLVAEDWGGDTIMVDISAKQKLNIDGLLEMILLLSEVEDLKANPGKTAIGTVIEARLDKQKGPTATLLVKSGTLKASDIVVANDVYGKIRVMSDDKGSKLREAGPSTAVEILGFNEVPKAGDKFFVAENEREARKFTDARKTQIRESALKKSGPVSLDDLFNQISEGELKELKLIVKADVQGSLEALKQSLEKLNDNDEGLKVSVIHGGVGGITESDIMLAASSNAIIIAFNVRPDANARIAAVKEEVDIRTYNVIYHVIEEIEQALKGLLDPEFKEVVSGTAEVREVFKTPVGNIGGSYITDGTIHRSDQIRVIRDGIIINEGTISSLRRFKDDVKEVATGYECGIGVEDFDDIKVGDTFEAFTIEEVARD